MDDNAHVDSLLHYMISNSTSRLADRRIENDNTVITLDMSRQSRGRKHDVTE